MQAAGWWDSRRGAWPDQRGGGGETSTGGGPASHPGSLHQDQGHQGQGWEVRGNGVYINNNNNNNHVYTRRTDPITKKPSSRCTIANKKENNNVLSQYDTFRCGGGLCLKQILFSSLQFTSVSSVPRSQRKCPACRCWGGLLHSVRFGSVRFGSIHFSSVQNSSVKFSAVYSSVQCRYCSEISMWHTVHTLCL